MLSLKQIILNSENSALEYYEKTPENTGDKNIYEEKKDENKKDDILDLLNSKYQTQILYALTFIAKNIHNNDNCIKYIEKITSFLHFNSQTIEYASIKTLQEISKVYPMEVFNVSYGDILQRLMFFPSEEYVEIICILFPSLPSDNFSGRLLPILLEMLKMDVAFQHAACELLTKCDFDVKTISNETFMLFLDSQILVSEYLLPISKKMNESSEPQWFKNFLLPQLITLSNNKDYSRVSVIRVILSLCSDPTDTNIYSFLLSAFDWADSSEEVEIEILQNSQFILQMKKAEFIPKLKEYVLKLQLSPNVSTRVKVVEIVARNPQLLKGSEKHFLKFIKSAAEDNSNDVKTEFIKYIELLSQSSPNNSIKEQVFNYFVEFFSVSDECVRNAIISSNYYSIIGIPKLNFLLPYFIRFAQFSSSNWRMFSQCINVFINFPDEIVLVGMKAMGVAVNQAVSASPFALAESCYNFYIKVATIIKPTHYEWFIHLIIKNYSQSKSHQLRAMFIHIAYIVGCTLPSGLFTNDIWPLVQEKANDTVASVRVAFLKHIPKYFDLFIKIDCEEEEITLFNISVNFKSDTDAYVKAVYHGVKKFIKRYSESERFKERKMKMHSGSTLPNLIKNGTKKIRPMPKTQKYRARGRSLQLRNQKSPSQNSMKRVSIPHKY